MENVRQYIISVISVSLICNIVNRWITGKGAYASVMKVISGLFLIITIVSPLLNILDCSPKLYFDSLLQDAEAFSTEGQLVAKNEQKVFIREKLESCILEKAVSLQMDISVDIKLDEELLMPQKITIYGEFSPYTKKIMSQFIRDNLGIAEEDQMWI